MLVNINEAVAILKSGGVIGIPTDTVYGLGCLIDAKSKIYEIKKRDLNKPLIKFVPLTHKFGDVPNEVQNMMDDSWPGAVTIIFEEQGILTSYRVPNEPNVLELLDVLCDELFTTSANLSGDEPCMTQNEFLERFPEIPLLEKKYDSQSNDTPSKIYIYKNNEFRRVR